MCNNWHAAKRITFIARSFLLVPLRFPRRLPISMLTRRRNSLGAPIKRRRVETRKWSDVSQIAFLAARYLRSFLGLFLEPSFFWSPPSRESLRNSRQEFGLNDSSKVQVFDGAFELAQESRKFTLKIRFFIRPRQGQARTLTPQFD